MIINKGQKQVSSIKKEIEENYNLKIKKLYKNKKDIYFFVNNKKIYIKEIDKTQENKLNELIKISNELYDKKKHSQTFLINKDREYTIRYKNKKIVLLLANESENTVINFRDVESNIIEIKSNNFPKYYMLNEWKKNIDKIENKLIDYNKEFPIIMKYANYYIGLAENSIQLLETLKKENFEYDYLGHANIENKYDCKRLSNPLNYIKTIKLYDMANYFKYKFYSDNIDYDELESIKKYLNDENNKKMFFALMVYQGEVFETMERILAGEEEEKEMSFYIKKINKLEEFLKYIQEKITKIRIITWLEEI